MVLPTAAGHSRQGSEQVGGEGGGREGGGERADVFLAHLLWWGGGVSAAGFYFVLSCPVLHDLRGMSASGVALACGTGTGRVVRKGGNKALTPQ